MTVNQILILGLVVLCVLGVFFIVSEMHQYAQEHDINIIQVPVMLFVDWIETVRPNGFIPVGTATPGTSQ